MVHTGIVFVMANFVTVGQTNAEIWELIDFSKWWLSAAILDLLYTCRDHPRRVIVGLKCSYHCAKFGLN